MKRNLTQRTGLSLLAGGLLLLATACGGGGSTPQSTGGNSQPAAPAASASKAPMITEVALGASVDQALAAKGKGMYELKCQSCHSLAENRIVGPGWKGVTQRRKPEWIMNMIMNTEAMLDTDPTAQKQLEECLVRMPNQNLNHDEARSVLEFMRTL